MRIVPASEINSEQILNFYNSSILSGDVDLRFEREDFLKPYQAQSDDHITYSMLNDKNQIEALASLVFRRGWLGGHEEVIGYATDLRVSSSRRAILGWVEHFLPILEQEKQKRSCQSVFTTVAQMQRQAYNAFIRPRLGRRPMPRYHLFRGFRFVSVHGILPWAHRPLNSIFLRQGTDSDWDILAHFLLSKRSRSVLHFAEKPEQILDDLRRWPGLRAQDFILAFDFHRNLVGCVALWSSDNLQKTYALAYHRRARVLYDSLKGLSYLGLSKRLPKGGRALHFHYLTHFCANNPDIFYSLLHSAFRTSDGQFVAYAHFDGDIAFSPPRAFITASMKSGLYCIQDPQLLSPQFLSWSRAESPPDFELPFM